MCNCKYTAQNWVTSQKPHFIGTSSIIFRLFGPQASARSSPIWSLDQSQYAFYTSVVECFRTEATAEQLAAARIRFGEYTTQLVTASTLNKGSLQKDNKM